MNTFRSQIITIQPPACSSEYIIGCGFVGKLHTLPIVNNDSITKFLLVGDKTVFDLYGKKIVDSLGKTGRKVVVSLVSPGEGQKSLQSVESIIQPFFTAGFDRNAVVIAAGGGVVTDIGNFLGSILLRGIKVIHIPTTLLSQIDAAIGGKGGLNFLGENDVIYKNMIGTIVQPAGVITDVSTLATLPDKEVINGLGEMVKYWVGWASPSQNQIEGLKDMNKMGKVQLQEIIQICQNIKLGAVHEDPNDITGKRQLLNLGHTIGHGLEAAAKGKLSHGQSVALGVIGAAGISVEKGYLSKDTYHHIVDIIEKVGLPTHVSGIRASDVLQSMKMDKKGGKFVLIRDIGKLIPGQTVEQDLIEKKVKELLV